MTFAKNAFAAAIAASLVAFVAPSQAASTATGNVGATATIVNGCVVTGATLNFGSAIDPTGASVPLDTSADISVKCTLTTPYSVALNAGQNAGGASLFSARAMKNGSSTLGYQLYADTLRAVVWGDGTNTSAVVPSVGTGTNQALTVYGRVPSLSGAVPGTYSDTVVVTVTY